MAAVKTLNIPFDSGLSQKTDALWLQPGSSSAATNLVKLKTGSLAKRKGFTALATVGVIPGSGTNASTAITLSVGKRLFSYNNQLYIVGTEANGVDAVWSYDDAAGQPLMLDRAPETYIYPPQFIAGTSANPFVTVPASRVVQCSTQIANGYEMSFWSVGDPTGGSGVELWYELRNATTGAVIVPAQVLISAGTHGGIDVPKLIAVSNRYFVATYSSVAGGDAQIYAHAWDTTSTALDWSTAVAINVSANDATFATGIWNTCAYAISPGYGGVSGTFGLIYERNVAATGTITLVECQVVAGSPGVVTSTAITDSGWVADSRPIIQGFTLRTDAGINEAAFAYAYTTATPTTRVHFGELTWPAMGALATVVDLLGTPGPLTPGTMNAPLILCLGPIGTLGSLNHTYRVCFSPGKATFRTGDAASAYPWIAAYTVSAVAGAATVAANHPRVTWNVALASEYLFAPVAGIGYVVGYIPSDTQGSHFILADDSMLDVNTPNNVGSGFARGVFPMRICGNLTPRQSSVQAISSTTFGSAAMMGLATPQYSRVPIPWAANPTFPSPSGVVFELCVPQDNSPITSVPVVYAVDFASTLSHAPSQLGGNVILASGCPSCFDGNQVFELGFPHYPVFALASTTGSSPGGTYSYIALYKWTDAAGQLHQSARSVPKSITLAATHGTQIICAVPGFSARMKAPNATASTTGFGPQAHLPLRRNIMVYLYRTVASGTVYYQCQPPIPVLLDSPTVTFNDDFTLSSDTNLVAQPLLYGDGSDGTQPGNILDDECPPAWQHQIVHNNRVYGLAGTSVWLTKEFTTFAGAGVNEATAFSVDDGPGNLLALGSMDGNLTLYKGDRLFTMSGQGPADNGSDNDLTPPQRITSDVGIVDWRSLVASKDGQYFMSAAGRRILTRDLQVQPVPVVEDIDTSNPLVTSAIVHPSAGRIVWSQNTNDSSSPRSGFLVFNDYILDSWSSTTLRLGSGFVSATVANSSSGSTVGLCYYGLTATGIVWRENTIVAGSTPYEDGGHFVGITWTSPWLQSDGLTGWSQWGQIQILLTQKDPAALTVQVAYDYVSTPTQTFTATAAQLGGQLAPGQPQALVKILPINQRAASMQLTISDASDTGTTTGQGFLLESLRIDYNVEPGGYRTPTSQQG